MIKGNLSNATRHKAILGLKHPACSAALAAFCATLGLGSAVAIADTFNVSTAAQFQAALNEAAVNGQDDTIILAAGTYSTAGNLSFTYTREETEGAPYVSDYGIMTEEPPDHAPFVYRHRFDDDVAGYSTCPKSGRQVCTEPYSLTITGAGEGATILDGGGASSALVFNLSFARPPEQEGVYPDRTVYDHGGILFVPDWDRVPGGQGFIYSTASETDDCTSPDDQPCNELIATLPAGIDDSGVLITVSDLTITNGLYSYNGSSTRQKANWRGCYHLHPSATNAPYDLTYGAWSGEDCAASGLSLISRNASLRLAGVTFTDNSASLTVHAWHDSAALVADTLGGNITLDGAVFLGNRNNHPSADQYGGAASLRSRIGDITVNNSVFGDGTAEGANSVEKGSEGGALRAMVGPALEWDTRDFRYPWRLPLRDDIDALNEARYSEFVDAGSPTTSREGELFPSDRAIGGKITVTGSSFLGNVIVHSSETTTRQKSGYGGGASLISHYGSRGVTVSDSVFTGNASPSKGGGLAIEAKSGTVLIEGSTFTDNFAGDQGGGIYVNSEVLVTIRNNTVTDNTVDGVSTTEVGIGDGTGYCYYDCEGGGIFARGAVSLIQNTITGNTITPNGTGSAYDGMGGGAAILAAGTPGAKLEIHRNHIGNNTTRFGTGGLYVISKHHDVTLTSNFIHDNRNTENVNNRSHDDSIRVGAGVSVRSQTGTINFVNNTVANNTMVHDRPSDASDNIFGTSFYNYPSGGVYISVEANEAKNWDTSDNNNHPNYRHDLPTGYGEYLVGPAQANVYNNNFWNNTVIDVSGGLQDITLNEGQAAATGTPPNGGLVDLILDNLTVYDDFEFDSPLDTGSVVNVFNNNFSTPENYYIACDPETMTCQQLAGANVSVDPQFQGEGPPFNNPEDGIALAPELSGSNDPNAPDQPEEDFFGNPIQGIGALWEALTDLIPVPVMGNLGLALLGLLLMVFGVRRLRTDTAG